MNHHTLKQSVPWIKWWKKASFKRRKHKQSSHHTAAASSPILFISNKSAHISVAATHDPISHSRQYSLLYDHL